MIYIYIYITFFPVFFFIAFYCWSLVCGAWCKMSCSRNTYTVLKSILVYLYLCTLFFLAHNFSFSLTHFTHRKRRRSTRPSFVAHRGTLCSKRRTCKGHGAPRHGWYPHLVEKACWSTVWWKVKKSISILFDKELNREYYNKWSNWLLNTRLLWKRNKWTLSSKYFANIKAWSSPVLCLYFMHPYFFLW